MFKELLLALKDRNNEEAERYASAVSEVMVDYLVVRHRADRSDAWDATQQTILILLEKGEQINLRDAGKSMAFVTAILRNEYVRIRKKSTGALKESLETYEAESTGADQLEAMVTREQVNYLRFCIETLSSLNKAFILHCMEQPVIEAEKVAKTFKISVNSAWTRKHRIIRSLSDCMRRKFKK